MRFTLTTLVASGLILSASGGAAREQPRCERGAVPCLPALEEHGPVADVPLPAPPSDAVTQDVPSLSPSRDLAPKTPLAVDEPKEELPVFDPSDAFLSSSLDVKAASLGTCRVEVARARAVRPTDLPDETVHLRLWVARDGRVTDSLVSVTGAIGPDFRDCVKRQVHDWWLLPPEGGRGAFVDVNVSIPSRGRPEVLPSTPPAS